MTSMGLWSSRLDLQKPCPSEISRRLHEFLKLLCCFRVAPQSFPLYDPAGISSYQIVLPACLPVCQVAGGSLATVKGRSTSSMSET